MPSLIPPGMKVAFNWPIAMVLIAGMATIVALAWLKVIDAAWLTHAVAFVIGALLPGPLGLIRKSESS